MWRHSALAALLFPLIADAASEYMMTQCSVRAEAIQFLAEERDRGASFQETMNNINSRTSGEMRETLLSYASQVYALKSQSPTYFAALTLQECLRRYD